MENQQKGCEGMNIAVSFDADTDTDADADADAGTDRCSSNMKLLVHFHDMMLSHKPS